MHPAWFRLPAMLLQQAEDLCVTGRAGTGVLPERADMSSRREGIPKPHVKQPTLLCAKTRLQKDPKAGHEAQTVRGMACSGTRRGCKFTPAHKKLVRGNTTSILDIFGGAGADKPEH